MRNSLKYYIAMVFLFCLCFFSIWRIITYKSHFDHTVQESKKISEGYDERFVNLVNDMEHDLASRAMFGYVGGKDPMSGKMRSVAKPKRYIRKKKKQGKTKVPVDPFSLTATIFGDESKTFTAIIMVDERSFAVEEGDKIQGRRITRILDEKIYMEDDSLSYSYDINGKSNKLRK